MPKTCPECLRWRGGDCTFGVPEEQRERCQIPELDAKRIRHAAMDRAATWLSDFPFVDAGQEELRAKIEAAVRNEKGPEEAIRAIRGRLALSCECPNCGAEVELEDGNGGDCTSCEGFLGEAEVSVINGR